MVDRGQDRLLQATTSWWRRRHAQPHSAAAGWRTTSAWSFTDTATTAVWWRTRLPLPSRQLPRHGSFRSQVPLRLLPVRSSERADVATADGQQRLDYRCRRSVRPTERRRLSQLPTGERSRRRRSRWSTNVVDVVDSTSDLRPCESLIVEGPG